jgi:hypothetical protein
MKVSTTVFAYVFVLSSLFSAVHAADEAQDETLEFFENPCAAGEEEAPECLDTEAVCTNNQTGCCVGLVCTGYGFYKKCSEPPVCLDMWHDCSDGTPCCDGTACTVGQSGQLECQTREIGKRTIKIPDGGGNLVQATEPPTPAPAIINTRTTKIDGQPVKKNIACSSGDPHSKLYWHCLSGLYALLLDTVALPSFACSSTNSQNFRRAQI